MNRSQKLSLLALTGLLLTACSPSDTTAPTVGLTASPKTVVPSGAVTLTATASDDDGVSQVTFYRDGTELGTDTSAPYTMTDTVPGSANGTIVYRAVATDPSGNKAEATDSVTVQGGTGAIQGIIVDQNIGAPVAGSTVTVYLNGTAVATVTSGTDGTFNLPNLGAGTYDLKARKTGMAGSDVYGLVVGTDAATVRLIQPTAFDPSATTNPAKLTLTRADGSTPLMGATFTNSVDFKISTAPDSDHVGPLRVLYAQLGRTPGSSSVTGASNQGNWNFAPPQENITSTTSGPVTLPNASFPNFVKGFGSASGDKVFMEIQAVDYNYNYSRYIVPITLINTAATAGNTVVAPSRAAAIAYTLKQEGSWTRPYSTPLPGMDASTSGVDAAPNGSGLFVELRWCYTNTTATAQPFAFDIERSSDGTNFTKIGTVGGGSDAACSASNQLARPFFYRDNSADLAAGKTFTYRVQARGANSVASNTTQTTPLAQFTPHLLSPADETTGVGLSPTFVISHTQQAIGADGAAYNLRLRDLMTLNGYNFPGNQVNATTLPVFRVEEGTGATGNGVPAGQSLVFTSALASNYVLTDTAGVLDSSKPNYTPVDTSAHTFSMPLDVFANPLQPLRPYKWEVYGAYAYKYLPAEGKRISAYSVYTWPTSSITPIPATRPVNQNFDFITGEQ